MKGSTLISTSSLCSIKLIATLMGECVFDARYSKVYDSIARELNPLDPLNHGFITCEPGEEKNPVVYAADD